MNIVLAIVIGIIAFLAGIGLAYSLLENRLNAQEQRHRARTRREIEDVERISAERMQKRIDALKAQYETQIQQLTHQLELAQAPPEPIVEPVPDEPEASLAETPETPETPETIVEPIVEPISEPEPEPITVIGESETIVESISELEPESIAVIDEPEEPETIVEPIAEPEAEPIAVTDELEEPETIVESISELEPEPIAVTPAYQDPPTTLEFGDEEDDLNTVAISVDAATIAPPPITLEDLKTIPYSAQSAIRLQLATNLLTLLQTQSHIELSKPLLINVLKRFSQDPTPQLRELAVLCLSKIRSPLVVPLLRQRLRDTEVAVVKAANTALEPWRGRGKLKASKSSKLKLKTRRPSN